MSPGFVKGQRVILCVGNGGDGREYLTSVLHVSGQELILKHPAGMEDGCGMSVTVRSTEKNSVLAEGEIRESASGETRIRCSDLSPTDEQRREMVREVDDLPIRFRIISLQEHQLRRSHIVLGDPSSASSRRLNSKTASDHLEEAESLVLECLQEINRKLDRLIEVMTLNVREVAPDYPGMVRDISGSGLRIETDKRLDEGAFLELKIGLPGREGVFFSGLAEVVRVTEFLSPNGKKSWEAAVRFTAIAESDQDRIVAYVLARQRAGLRYR